MYKGIIIIGSALSLIIGVGYLLFTVAVQPDVQVEKTTMVIIAPAGLQFSPSGQNIASIHSDEAHGFERALANPTLTQLTVGGVPYVYMLMRVSRAVDHGTRLTLARIPASQFSNGITVTDFTKWDIIPDTEFTVTTPTEFSSVLNAAMTAYDGKILITYQANSRTDDSVGFLVVFDPVSKKIIWSKNVQTIPGYQGDSQPTGLTRVTADPVALTGDYFDSTKGRLVIGYACRQDSVSACIDQGKLWDGFVVQELVLDDVDTPHFLSPVRVLREDVSPEMTVAKWRASGETVWKKQSFNLGNAGNDTLIFSVNYNIVNTDNPENLITRDFPTNSSFFTLSALSMVLDRAKTGLVDISHEAPSSKTWVADLTNDSPWDQGALWNSMVYIDPFQDNKKFVVYESWGAEYMQLSQTRNALYGGSSNALIKSGQEYFAQSCNQYCATKNIAGGGARKPYCLSATAVSSGTMVQGIELPHSVPFNQIKDPLTAKGINSAFVVCSDIGTSDKNVNDIRIITSPIETLVSGTSALSTAEAMCMAKGAKGVVWIDRSTPSDSTSEFDVSDTASVQLGQLLTVACSAQHESGAFKRSLLATSSQTCDMACSALGVGNGTGYRSYRSRIINNPTANQNSFLDPFTSLDYFIYKKLVANTSWLPMSETKVQCTCGPGREMRGVASARVAP